MALDPLQGALPTRGALPQNGTGRKVAGASAFAAVLASAGAGRANGTGRVQQAAAEALRIAMMQQSLALLAGGEAPHAATLGTLDAVLSSLAGQATAPAAQRPSPPPSAVPGGAGGSGDIEETASRFLGTPYRFGGEGADGIDCSSFVQQVFREHRIELPRTAREQRSVGAEVAPQDLRKGDLVFFETYSPYPSHVGIYLGEGRMIHASSVQGAVTVSDINSGYYRSRYLGARRVA
jgi:cell wall-associated NlpC family hydrolase